MHNGLQADNTIAQSFNKAAVRENAPVSSPLKLDVNADIDIRNVLKDPLLAAQLGSLGFPVYVLDDKGVERLLKTVPRDVANHLRKGEFEHVTYADVKPVFDLLSEDVPQLLEAVKAKTAVELKSGETQLPLEHAFQSRLINMIFEPFDYAAGTITAGEGSPKAGFVRVPNKNAIPEFLKTYIENAGLKPSAVNPPPGTARDYAALVTIHELEHLVSEHTLPHNATRQHLSKKLGEDIPERLETLLMEVEADLSAMTIMERQVNNPAVLDFWRGLRVALGSHASFNHYKIEISMRYRDDQSALDQDRRLADWKDVPYTHSTGFYLTHHDQTGELPDFEGFMAAQNQFFERTSQLFLREIASEFDRLHGQDVLARDPFILKQCDMFPPRVMVDFVRDCMKADPPVYTPEEMQMAQIYMHQMQETLGVRPKDSADYIKDQAKDMERFIRPPMPDYFFSPAAQPAAEPGV